MKSQIGFLVTWYPGFELTIDIPFVTIYILVLLRVQVTVDYSGGLNGKNKNDS